MFYGLTASLLAAAAVLAAPAEASVNAAEIPGFYASELTGMAISTALQPQRPVAFMIDNDQRAMPHYGLAEADVVYEMMNSTKNNRVTRLMAVYKDWNSVARIGNIRSTRPTNVLLAAEYDAVLCHDGGPFYINPYISAPWASPHFSGNFSRVPNGKPVEFTEYCLPGDLIRMFSRTGTPTTYTAFKGQHFIFGQTDLSQAAGNAPANSIALPFAHNRSALMYNALTQTYDYYEFGAPVKDGEDGQQVTFKNVIIQDCTFTQYDANGYLIYNCIDICKPGYYCTNGRVIPIMWTKYGETGLTKYYEMSGKEIVVNPGKTYITLIPEDSWGLVAIQ